MTSIYLIPMNDGTEAGEAFGYTEKRYNVYPGKYDPDTDDTDVFFDQCLGTYDTLEKAEMLKNALETSNFYLTSILIYDNVEEVFYA